MNEVKHLVSYISIFISHALLIHSITYMHTHTCMQGHTHEYTYTQIYMHTHTHTHSESLIPQVKYVHGSYLVGNSQGIDKCSLEMLTLEYLLFDPTSYDLAGVHNTIMCSC